MPTIINPVYSQNPLGQALSQLGQQMFGDTLTPALKREQLYGAQRQNTELGRMMEMARSGNVDPNQFGAAAIGAGNTDYGNMFRFLTATDPNAGDDAVTRAQRGSGMAESSTVGGFNASLGEQQRQYDTSLGEKLRQYDASLGEQQRQFDQTPVEALVGGQPTFVPRSGAFGEDVSPILSNTERQGTPRTVSINGQTFVTYDMQTNALTGEPLPASADGQAFIGNVEGAPGDFGDVELREAREDLMARRVGVQTMTDQIGFLRDQLRESGDALGVLGSAARVINDWASQADILFRQAGVAVEPGVRDPNAYMSYFRESGIDNAVMQSVIVDLAYSIATSREPGKLTEVDVDRALRTLGGRLQDPVAMEQVLASVGQRVTAEYLAREKVYREQYPNLNLVPFEVPSIGNLAPAASGAPQSGAAKVFERGPDGQLQRVQ